MNTSMKTHNHILSRHEHAMFFHPNPDIQRWWRFEFLDRVSNVALQRGVFDWDIYDAAENRVAQGCMPGPEEEW